MKSKRLTVIRVIVFTLLANALMIVPYHLSEDLTGFRLLLTVIAGLSPAIANGLTRLITREGAGNSFLRANLQGNAKFYLGGMGAAAVMQIASMILLKLIMLPDVSFSDMKLGFGEMGAIMLSFSGIFINFWVIFGEEFGWRAYLTPKLEELMPEPAALVVSGIIWGLWHACPIASGLNFGLDYPGFPYAGWAAMCIPCIFIGSLLTYLTKKTGSVFPAALCHAAINYLSVMSTILPQTSELNSGIRGFVSGLIVFVPNIIIGAVCMYLLCRKKPNHNVES